MTMLARRVLCICVVLAFQARAEDAIHPEPARTHGWAWKTPPDMVTPKSAKRNHIFYVGEPVVFELGGAATNYEVRDYWGNVVDKAPATASITVNVKQPGWYKLYVYGKEVRKEWGDIVGGTTFVIFRNNTNFPPLPAKDAPDGAYYPSMDQIIRGVTGMGPQRHNCSDLSKPDVFIKNLDGALAIDNKLYVPFDPLRKRVLMVAFSNGTKDAANVKKIVEHFKNDIQYWEPRNEPNYGSSAADFVNNELKPFYETVKGVDPKLKVLGPGVVSVGPNLYPWLEDFFKAGGAKFIDAFSFHVYNGVNGDVFLARKTMDGLNALLAQYGVEKLEKWQTEQGFFCAVYGDYQPHLQGRWTMVEMMVFEQYGIPKEHNHLWYDRSHGFWDVPTWWENDDTSLNPAAPLMRVWSEELLGTQFAKAFDFGPAGNKLYVGSLFSGPNKNVAAFISAGEPNGSVDLAVKGGTAIHVVSAFGVEQDLPIKDGVVTLTVPEIPVYVELAAGQTIEPLPFAWGTNLALLPGVVAASSGCGDETSANGLPKIHNGKFENWYFSQQPDSVPFMDASKEFPAWVELRLPAANTIERVVVYACPPWQLQGTLLDYDLQYDANGKWETIESVQEPVKTFGVYSPPTRTSVDSFFSDHWIFEHHFKPITTQKIRLLVRNVTWGGGATLAMSEGGGQTGYHQITLREIEVYAPPDPVMATVSVDRSELARPEPLKLSVNVLRYSGGTFKGQITPVVPAGWTVKPATLPVEFEQAGERKRLEFSLTPGEGLVVGQMNFSVNVLDGNGTMVSSSGCAVDLNSPVVLTASSESKPDGPMLTVTLRDVLATPFKGKLVMRALTANPAAPVEKPFETDPSKPAVLVFPLKDFDLLGKAMTLQFEVQTDIGVTLMQRQTLQMIPYRIMGPFSNANKKGFTEKYPPETALDFTQSCTTEEGVTPWKNAVTAPEGFLDFLPLFKKNQWVVAYAATYVNSPVEQAVTLSCGSDDGIKVWINGKEVLAVDAYRGATPDTDTAKVALKQGANLILVKVTQGDGGWRFYLNFRDAKNALLDNLTYSLDSNK